MADNPSMTGLRESLSRNGRPVVVLVFMGVAGDRSALIADSLVGIIARMTPRVRMRQVLGIDLLDGDSVEVTNFCEYEVNQSGPHRHRDSTHHDYSLKTG